MTKSELTARLAAKNPHLMHRDVERIVHTVFETIAGALESGARVELRGFGAFSTKQRGARTGRNPRTGDPVDVEEKFIPAFKVGKQLTERLQGADVVVPDAAARAASHTAEDDEFETDEEAEESDTDSDGRGDVTALGPQRSRA